MTSGKSGDSSSCSRSPMKKSSCRGLPTTVAGKIASARCAIRCTSNTGIVVLQRVVAVVIAERPFGLPHVRRHVADQRELRRRHQRMRSVAVHLRQPLAGDERRQQQLGHVLGQRRDRRQDQRRRAAEEHGGRQPLSARLGHGVVIPAALADLPVHPGGARARAPACGTCRGCGRGDPDAWCRRAAA